MTNNMNLKLTNLSEYMKSLSESVNGSAYVIEMIGDLLDKREIVEDYGTVHDEQTKRVVQANDYLLLQLENVLKYLQSNASHTSSELDTLSCELEALHMD